MILNNLKKQEAKNQNQLLIESGIIVVVSDI